MMPQPPNPTQHFSLTAPRWKMDNSLTYRHSLEWWEAGGVFVSLL